MQSMPLRRPLRTYPGRRRCDLGPCCLAPKACERCSLNATMKCVVHRWSSRFWTGDMGDGCVTRYEASRCKKTGWVQCLTCESPALPQLILLVPLACTHVLPVASFCNRPIADADHLMASWDNSGTLTLKLPTELPPLSESPTQDRRGGSWGSRGDQDRGRGGWGGNRNQGGGYQRGGGRGWGRGEGKGRGDGSGTNRGRERDGNRGRW